MKINQVLVESAGATVAFAFGRFNPAHQGHIEVWRAVEQAGANWFIGTNPSTLGPNDPLTFQQKSAWMTEIYPPISGHIVAEQSVLTLAAYIFKKTRKNESATVAYITDAADWAWSGKLLNQYNGVEGAHGYYKFAEIAHVPSPRVSSATALRDAARADDKVAFYHASGTDPKDKVAGLTYFDTVKQACEKYPLPVKKAKKVKEQGVAEDSSQKTFTVVYYSKKTDRNVTKTIKANNQSEVWDKLKSNGIDVVSVKEQGLNEFAPGSGGGESGRWYTDDQLTDLVGDGWWNDLDISGDVSKQEMIQEAQAWLDDQGYSVQVLNCKVNDDDMEWYIEGSFQNSGFAKKGMAEANPNQQLALWHPETKSYQGSKNKIPTSDYAGDNDITTNYRKVDNFKHSEVNPLHKGDDSIEKAERNVNREQLAKLVKAAFNILTSEEKEVLNYRFWHDMTLDSIAQKMSISGSRVRQIEAQAFRKLKKSSNLTPVGESTEQKTVAKTWDQMTAQEKSSGVKGRTVWNEKTKKYYTVFDVPTTIKEDEEAGEVKKTGQLIPFPAGTTKVHVSDVYDWYKLGQVISDLDDANPNTFGQGAPQSIIAFGSEEEESKLLPLLKRLGLKVDDIDPEGTDEIGEAYHAGSLYEMLNKERTKGWALTNKKQQ